MNFYFAPSPRMTVIAATLWEQATDRIYLAISAGTICNLVNIFSFFLLKHVRYKAKLMPISFYS
jgi:hypothetical protein